MRTRRNAVVVRRAVWEGGVKATSGMGSRRAISMSKTRKIKARRKKRRENGIRACFLGSNPHSKGEVLSRLGAVRLDKIRAVMSVIALRVLAITMVYKRIFM